MDTMDKNIIFLHPNEIGVHPTVEYLERGGVFSYDKRHLDMMVESIRSIDFLQPILVTPAPEESDKKYLRVAGKLRVEAARALGQTVPCYVREFESEEMLIEAIKSENSKRRWVDVLAIEKETKLIDKLISERAKKAAQNERIALQNIKAILKESGVKQDNMDTIIDYIRSLPSDIQESAARAIGKIIKNISVVEVKKFDSIPDGIKSQIEEGVKKEIMSQVKNEIDNYRNSLENAKSQIKNLEAEKDQLAKQIKKLQANIELKTEEDENSKEVINSLRKKIDELKKEIIDREVKIKNLNTQIYEAQISLKDDLYDLSSKKNTFISIIIDTVITNIRALLEQIKNTLQLMHDPSTTYDDILLVFNKYSKSWGGNVESLHKEILTIMQDLHSKKKKTSDNGDTHTEHAAVMQ